MGGGLALAATCLLTPVQNPDLYWHLSAGRRMALTGALPREDFLSHTMAGRPWLDFEWLAQILYYWIFSLGGCAALLLLRGLLLGALAGVVLGLLSLHGLGPAARGLGVLWLAAALLPLADLRPDNFSLLFFAALFYALEAYRLGRWRLGRAQGAACFLLFALWSNLHLGSIHGLILIALYGLGELMETTERRVSALGPLKPYALLLALALLGSLANPFGWRLPAVILEHWRDLDILRESICEWKPPELGKPWFWPYAALLFLGLPALLYERLRTGGTPLAHVLGACAFGFASAMNQRQLSYLVVFMIPVLWRTAATLGTGRWGVRMIWSGATLAFALLTAHVGRTAWPHLPLWSTAAWCQAPARRLADFLSREAPALAGKRLYNTWGDGGYLGYRLSPAYQVFQDGRYLFHRLLAETIAAASSPEHWQGLMDRHGVEVACLKRSLQRRRPGTVLLAGGKRKAVWRPYYVEYLPAKDWALVYWDERDMVMVRRRSVDRGWLERHEYRLWLPDQHPPPWLLLGPDPRQEALLRREASRHARDLGASLGGGFSG